MVACTEPRSKIPTLSEGVAQHPRRPLASFLGLARTYIEQTRGISHSPSPLLLTTGDCPPASDYYWIKSFRCNTYGSPRKRCKQKTYGLTKPFRCNTYKKHGVASFKPDIFLYPLPADCPPIFHLPYTLPSSVSRKPFIYHSCENTGGVRVFFPFWNSARAIKACMRPCAIIGVAACASGEKASRE